MDKIAFIICTNNEQLLSECLYYINQLNVPDGYELELLAVTDATSIAAGYNEGMNSSNARYKFYLHHDLFLLNRNILFDTLKLFQQNEDIGMLGCIGCRKIPQNAYAISAWDTGKILQTAVPLDFQDNNLPYTVVDAVDGCFLATQYDIPWREDLFDGWDFYDISQCYEFHRIGKKIAVPYQEVPWCYHGNNYCKMQNYHKYRKIFINEYQDISSFSMENPEITFSEYKSLIEETRTAIGALIDTGNTEQAYALFTAQENRGYLALKEYELLADIYYAELNTKEQHFHLKEMSRKELLFRLHNLQFLIKRIEFKSGSLEDNIQLLIENFSLAAIRATIMAYCNQKNEVWQNILTVTKK